jgi:hypothetical protein
MACQMTARQPATVTGITGAGLPKPQLIDWAALDDFEVVIPWHDNGNPQRAAALEAVTIHLAELERRVRVSDPGEPWSAAKARNDGARRVEAPVVVFNDADTLVPLAQIREAAALAGQADGLVYAYDLYLRRDEQGGVERELYNPVSVGCVAIGFESFWRLNGFDERFKGAFYEDCEFAQRAQERWPLRRVTGVAEHLWHGGRRADDSADDQDEHDVQGNLILWRALSRQWVHDG